MMKLLLKKNVDELLDAQRQTKKALAEHLDMTPQGLDLALKNTSLTAAKLVLVAEFFKVSPSYFFEEEHSTASPKLATDETSYLRDMVSRLESTFTREVEQKNSQIAGLQRMVDFLMQSQPQPKPQTSFSEPVAPTEDVPVIKLNSKMQVVKVG